MRSPAKLARRIGRGVRAWRVALGTLALVAGPPALVAQDVPDTLRITEVLALARERSPRLLAARSASSAAAERVSPAGTLPDPVLSLGLMNRPLDGFGTGEPMTMNQVQLSQELPWPGTLGARREAAVSHAVAEVHVAAEAEATLLAEVLGRYFAVAATDRTLRILERNLELLRDDVGVTQSRYEVGEAPQQDLLQAQVSVARMSEEIVVRAQRRLADIARLNALLGRAASTPLPALELPAIGAPVAPVDSLLAIARTARPALRSAEARRRAVAAEVGVARRERYPDLMLGVAWGQRPAHADMASLMLEVRLPVRAASRQQPRVREMEALAVEADAALLELVNATWADLVEARAEAERARALGELYASAILPQAAAAVESALTAYRVGGVDYSTLIASRMTVNQYEIALVEITAAYHQALARIDALLGRIGGDR